ncbi:MAG: ShlB/FhaC/HecB family hemolysin secretion/activation protein [Xanthobacteraceae bacterium]
MSVTRATAAAPSSAQPASAETGGDETGSNSASAKKRGSRSDGAKPDAAKADGDKSAAKPAAPAAPAARFDIDEYRVVGADALPQIEVEEAVYPFLGPGKTADDVEKARASLEKAYHDKGYQTVNVAVPQQDATRGFVVLKVSENKVGRLRVKGSRYFDLDNIKHKAASLQEGSLPNFNAVTKDIVSLNQWPDRRVTPALRAGVAPGTVDVDLNVEDKLPFHGTVEINNRQSPFTTPLRTNVTLHYDDLWQRGDSATFTYQVAPQRRSDAEVFSGSYLARTELDWLNILVYGLTSASSVATVGGINVVGPGQVIGSRAVISLPSLGELVHTISIGADFKHFEQTVGLGTDAFSSPVTYVPLVASYSATWQGDGRLTQLNASITAGLRGIGSTPADFEAKRADATESFITLRADLSHTQDLPAGVQLFTKVQGQLADQPLVSSEQFSLGGQDTVRGYLESEVLGDYGAFGTVELRTPNIGTLLAQPAGTDKDKHETPFNPVDEWRFFAFGDAGRDYIHDPLAGQATYSNLASYGIGTRFKLVQYLNGVVLVAMPVTSQQITVANHPRTVFRIWGEF